MRRRPLDAAGERSTAARCRPWRSSARVAPSAGAAIEHPTHLRRREVRVEDEAGRRAHRRAVPWSSSAWHRAAVRRSCHTMARWRGAPRLAVEADRCFSLVRDADARRFVARRRGRASATSASVATASPAISLASCSTSPGGGEELGELAIGLVEDLEVGGQRRRCARPSCRRRGRESGPSGPG